MESGKAIDSEISAIEKLFTNLYKLKKCLDFIKTHEIYTQRQLFDILDINSNPALVSIAKAGLIKIIGNSDKLNNENNK